MLTSSFMVQMNYTKEEISAKLMLERERAQRGLEKVAARYLQSWFRQRQREKVRAATGMQQLEENNHDSGGDEDGRDAHKRHLVHKAKQVFRTTMQLASAETVHLLADDVKIDQLAERCKDLVEAVETVKRRTDPGYVHASDSEEEDLNEFEQAAKWQARQIMKRQESEKVTGNRLGPVKHRGTLKGKMAHILLQKKLQQAEEKPNIVFLMQEAAHVGELHPPVPPSSRLLPLLLIEGLTPHFAA